MRATEIFGPIGEGWGYEVLEEKFIDGKPLLEPVLDERNKQVATRFYAMLMARYSANKTTQLRSVFGTSSNVKPAVSLKVMVRHHTAIKTNYGIKVDGEAIKNR